MPYGALIDIEEERSLEEIADYLRVLADDIEEGGDITVTGDDDSVTVDLPGDTLDFEIELEREPDEETDEIELELELEWELEDVEMDLELE